MKVSVSGGKGGQAEEVRLCSCCGGCIFIFSEYNILHYLFVAFELIDDCRCETDTSNSGVLGVGRKKKRRLVDAVKQAG